MPDTRRFSRSHPSLQDTEGEDTSDQFDLSSVMFCLEGKTRGFPWIQETDYLRPPTMLELRHYFNLAFKSDTFWAESTIKPLLWKEVGRGDIFLNPRWAVV